MTGVEFHSLALALWGEGWRPRVLALLAEHGHAPTRQTVWNWKTGKTPLPCFVAVLLTQEAERVGVPPIATLVNRKERP